MLQMRTVGLAVLIGVLALGCTNGDTPTSPQAKPLFSKGAGGGGGTDVPPNPVPTTTPTLTVTTATLIVYSDQRVAVTVIATSEGNNRQAPGVSIASAPAGFTLNTLVTQNSPHGGGPGHTVASYFWTPTRAQIGLTAHIAFTAATSGGTTTQPMTLGPVHDAPTPLSGLTATAAAAHIEARWQASTGGVGPITYVVRACYENANIRPVVSTCDIVATTTDTQALAIPLVNPSPMVAPAGGIARYFFVSVTPQDANGVQGDQQGVDVQ